MKSFVIGVNDAGQRVDKFLQKAVKRLPINLMYKYIRTKKIKVNGKRCKEFDILKQDDIVALYIKDEFFDTIYTEYPFLQAPDKIDAVYEDENIIVLNKPSGLIVHEDDEESIDTLINRVTHYLFKKGEYNPLRENSFAPALCNRIDRNTEGLVIAAKNAGALRLINEKIKLREINKYYLTIVHGKFDVKHDTLTAYLSKDAEQNTVYVSDRPATKDAKTIKTRYKVISENDRFSLVEIELLTGRTHQIRAHMAHIGHPLLGDTKYGTNKLNKGTKFKHQVLCSYKLEFKFMTSSNEFEYLNGLIVEVPSVKFYDDFLRGKIK